MKETKIEWDVHQYPENPRAFVTNGLNKFGSLEIEIVWPLYMHDGVAICNLIAHAIREGLKIEDGLYVAEVFPSPVLFIKTKAAHEDIEVYRVIFPDGNGNFPWDINGCLSCDERFKNQITFEKDKVLLAVLSDCETVERAGSYDVYRFNGFEKRGNTYIRPLRYFIGGVEADLASLPPYMTEVNDVQRFVSELFTFSGVAKECIKVVCIDADASDPINAGFYEWKEKHC